MSDGAAVLAGLGLGFLVVGGFFALLPFASDAVSTDEDESKMLRDSIKVLSVVFPLQVTCLLVAIVFLDPLPTIVFAVTVAVTGLGLLLQRRRRRASDGSA